MDAVIDITIKLSIEEFKSLQTQEDLNSNRECHQNVVLDTTLTSTQFPMLM